MKKILIVDDDEVIRRNLDSLLANEYLCFCAQNSYEALKIIDEKEIDLCLLDVNLKNENGFELCKNIRERYTMPIIFITVKDDEDSLEEGMVSGGDDYIVKPFSIKEVKLRIMAQLRRSSYVNKRFDVVSAGIWKLDLSRHVFSCDDIQIEISNTEFVLLERLMNNRGCLVRREILLDDITNINNTIVENNTLSVHMSRLRNKMIKVCKEYPIETIRGIGYRWKEQVS